MNLRTIANDMALVAQKNPHDCMVNPICADCCGRRIAYGEQMLDVVFTLDLYSDVGKSAWHLSVTPERPLSAEEVQDILLAFFGVGKVIEMTEEIRAAFPIPKLQRQFIKLIE